MRSRNGRAWVVALILATALIRSSVTWGQGAPPPKPAAAPAPAGAKPASAPAETKAAPAANAATPAQPAAKAASAANAPAPAQTKAAPAANAPAPEQPAPKAPSVLSEKDAKLPINPILLSGLILGCVVWIAGVSWLNRDALENMIHRSNWTLALYGVSIVGLVGVHFVNGLFVWAMLGAQIIVLGAYIFKRNGQVHPSKQVWTLHHIDGKLGHIFSHLRIIRPTKASEASRTTAHISFLRRDGTQVEPEVGKPHGVDLRSVVTLKELVSRALAERASNMQLEIKPNEVVWRLRIDGMLHTFPSLRSDVGGRVIASIKAFSGIDAAPKTTPQEGSFSARVFVKPIDLRVVTQPGPPSEVVNVRILNKDTDLLRLDATGLRPDQLQRVKAFTRNASGLCLVCGPPGVGKRTSLHAMIMEIDARLRPIATIESSIDYRLPGVTQTTANPKVHGTFANALRECLKHDPKVIMLDELRDADAVRAAMNMAVGGRLVLSTFQVPDAMSAITRLMQLKIEPDLIASSLKMIIAQRLARLLCTTCRLPANLRPEQLRKMGIIPGPNVALFRAKGCAACHSTGHFGRTGLLEVLDVNAKIREMIVSKATPEAIKQEARRGGFVSLLEDGYKKVANGATSIEEVVRVVR